MSEKIFLYIIIGIIWAIISLINQANKKQKKYNNKKIEYEEEIFKNLNNTLNSEKTIDNPKVEKVKEKENKIYETSNKEKEILELQKKYNSIINDNKNIIESVNTINLVSDKKTNNINNVISSLNIKNAIIYNAILEPKRLNYRRIKKS
ncbi:hypothetical protein [uncultured Brachyspira sp.]|uniref:hypothetical protein n=1 Tax=uncultured Brachyspira sp. TaxID=221953 RepID=UPI00259B52ED|nr:hypothetical protein [uncultured Brachyspira sp.]